MSTAWALDINCCESARTVPVTLPPFFPKTTSSLSDVDPDTVMPFVNTSAEPKRISFTYKFIALEPNWRLGVTRYSPGITPSTLKVPSAFVWEGPKPTLLDKTGRRLMLARNSSGNGSPSIRIRPEIVIGGTNVSTTPSTSAPVTSTATVANCGLGGG